MGQLVYSVAGAAVGFFVGGPTGAQYGWMAGSLVGALAAKPQQVEAPKIDDLRLPRMDLGQSLTWVAGSPWVSGNVVWASDKRPVAHTEEAGGKGGGVESTSYTYEIDLFIKLSENVIAGVGGVTRNGELIYDGSVTRSGVWSALRVYTGEEGQLPDPDYEAAVGAARAQAHLGCGSVFIKSLQLDSGGNLPVLRFLISSYVIYRDSDIRLLMKFNEPAGSIVFSDSSVYSQNVVEPAFIYTGSTYIEDVSGKLWLKPPNTTAGTDTACLVIYENVAHPDSLGGINNAGSDYSAEIFFLPEEGALFRAQPKPIGLLADRIGLAFEIYENAGSYYIFVRIIPAYSGGTMSFSPTHFPSINSYLDFTPGKPNHLLWMKKGTRQYLFINGVEWADNPEPLARPTAIPAFEFIEIGSVNFQSYGFPRVSNFRFSMRAMYDETGFNEYTTLVNGHLVKNPLAEFSAENYSLTEYARLIGSAQVVAESISEVVAKLMWRAGYRSDQFDVTALESITKPVRGLAISRVTNTRTILELLSGTHWFTWQKRGFKLVFVPRPVAAVGSIPYADIGVSMSAASDDPRLELTRPSMIELPARVSVTYPNTLNTYQPDTQVSDYILSQQQSVANQELAVGMTPTEAKAVADAMQADQLAAMARATIKVPLAYAKYEPGDVITITDADARQFRVRIETRRDQLVYLEFGVVLDDINATLSAGITGGGQTGPSTVQQVAPTQWVALDMPRIRDVDGGPGWWVGAAPGVGELWPGAVVLGSWNGTDYGLLAELPERAVFGTTTTALGSWTGGNVFDTTNSVTVSINGEASSHTRAAMLADLTLGVWLIGSEVVRARTATLVSAGVYRLSNLIRGFRGTEWAMGTHAVDERAVLINGRLRRVEGQQAHIDVVRQLKGVTAGLSAATVTAQAFTDTGIALKPFSPVDLLGTRDAATSDLALTWRRRTRLSHRFLSPGIDPPLGEASELYDVEIWDAAFTTLKRTFASVTTPAQAYTSAQQTTDFGAPQSSVGVRVYQRSEAVGRGYKLQGVA